MGRERRPSDRVRVPPPLIRRRVRSGRGATEQPNAVGDGDAPLTARFWLLVLLTGAAAGLFGDVLMLVLFSVEHLAFGFHRGNFEQAVLNADALRRVASLLVAGAVGGLLWYLLRRVTPGERTDADDTVWTGASLSPRGSLASGLISEFVIGMGASLGREAAPRLMGAVSGSVLATRFSLSEGQRRLLVACGAGAGLAAVYNVPLGGALFTAEVMLGSLALPTVLPALACSAVATGVAWLYLPDHATYLGIPDVRAGAAISVFAVVAGPLIGVAATGIIRLFGCLSHHRARGRLVLVAPLVAFGVLGLIGIAYPQLFGNGRDLAEDVLFGQHEGFAFLVAMLALKPLVTALCIESGASGGVLTPTFATGAVLGSLLGSVWSLAWPGTPSTAYALVGAAAMLGAAMQAPLAALAIVLEH